MCSPVTYLIDAALSASLPQIKDFIFHAISVVSSVYMRLLIFLPAILIPAYASSSPAFKGKKIDRTLKD